VGVGYLRHPNKVTAKASVRPHLVLSPSTTGYIRLKYGSNTCDITNDPTYVEVASA